MPIIKLKLPAKLKKRVSALVETNGRTAHAFMVGAIAQATEREERRQRFLASAGNAEQDLQRTGKTYDLDRVFDYLEARVKNSKAKRPS